MGLLHIWMALPSCAARAAGAFVTVGVRRVASVPKRLVCGGGDVFGNGTGCSGRCELRIRACSRAFARRYLVQPPLERISFVVPSKCPTMRLE